MVGPEEMPKECKGGARTHLTLEGTVVLPGCHLEKNGVCPISKIDFERARQEMQNHPIANEFEAWDEARDAGNGIREVCAARRNGLN